MKYLYLSIILLGCASETITNELSPASGTELTTGGSSGASATLLTGGASGTQTSVQTTGGAGFGASGGNQGTGGANCTISEYKVPNIISNELLDINICTNICGGDSVCGNLALNTSFIGGLHQMCIWIIKNINGIPTIYASYDDAGTGNCICGYKSLSNIKSHMPTNTPVLDTVQQSGLSPNCITNSSNQ